MIEGKGLGGKKVNRVGLSLSNHYSNNLNKLATACGMRPTTLAAMILEMCLDDAMFISKLQNDYCKFAAYRIRLAYNHGSERFDYLLYDKNERDDF